MRAVAALALWMAPALLAPALLLLPGRAGAQALERESDLGTQGRVSAWVSLGGGYRSDLYLGAGLPGQGVADAAPSAELDLSLAPWLKLFSELDGSAEHAFQSGAGAYGLYGDALLQLRPVTWLYPELLLAARQDWFTNLSGPVDPSAPTGPLATNSHQLSAGPGVRSVVGPLEARLLGLASLRVSNGLEQFQEQILSLTAYLGYQLHPRLRAGLQYQLGQTSSPSAPLAFWGQELSLRALANLAPGPVLRAQASLRRNDFVVGGASWLPRASLSATQPVWAGVSLEAAYRFELVTGAGYAAPATLHMAYLGVRAEGGPWLF
jgi:hypothetical protein